jgi:hypothetical protein
MLLNAELFFGAAIIIIGLALETMGWKIHRQIIGLSGLIVGLVVGDFIGTQLLGLNFILWRVIILAFSSLLFIVLFFVYMRISIGITSGIMGSLIISGFTSSRTLAEWNLNYAIFQTNYNYPSLILAFAISSYAGYRFYKLGYLILSTGIGSIIVAYGGIISGFWTYDNLGIFLLLSLLLGVILQLSQEGVIRERRLQIRTFKFCAKCGKPLEANSGTCSRCGNPITSDDYPA